MDVYELILIESQYNNCIIKLFFLFKQIFLARIPTLILIS